MPLCIVTHADHVQQRAIHAHFFLFDDAPYAVASIITAVAEGRLTLSESTQLAKLVELYVSTYEASRRESRADLQMTRQDEDRREEKDRRRRLGGF